MVCVIKAYYNVEESESFKNEFKKISNDKCDCEKDNELIDEDDNFDYRSDHGCNHRCDHRCNHRCDNRCDHRCDCHSDDKRNELIYRPDHRPDHNYYKVSVDQTIDRIPLYNECSCRKIGTIQFNNIEYNKKICHDNLYDITENISIQFDDCNETQIFAENFYRSKTNYYKDCSKHIIKIISCTGDFLGKTGFIVIDVIKNKRLVYIKFD